MVVEVFSSLQGEGLRLGERQIFVRFGGCNLRCEYCDEPPALLPHTAGEPWPRPRLCAEIERLQAGRPHAAVAWTGGEPLLQARFLHPLLEWARSRGLRNYLETNGLLSAEFEPLAKEVDTLAVDLKLPSAVGRALWDEHAAFLTAVIRAGVPEAFAKVVLTSASTQEEWSRVLDLMEACAPGIPLILQPATPGPASAPLPAGAALGFLDLALRRSIKARLIPQWHPVWGLR